MGSLLCKHKGKLCAIAVLLAAAAQGAAAAGIAWAKKGEFETCLESSLDKWLATGPSSRSTRTRHAAKLDDAAVAAWTIETIAQCRAWRRDGGRGVRGALRQAHGAVAPAHL